MLEFYIFTSFLLYQGFAVPLSSADCNGIECDDLPDCSNNSCPCLHPSKIYCNIYYICIDDMVQKFSCSSGLLFDEDNLTCDYKDNVDCKNRTQVPPSISSTQQVSSVKDFELYSTIKYSHLSEVETTPITINDIASSSQTDEQESTDGNSTLTISDKDEAKTSTSASIINVTEISSSEMDPETVSSTLQANATEQRPVSEEVTSEATQSHDEETSEATSQSQDEETSEATSKRQDEDTSEVTNQSQDENISEATSQSQNDETTENTLVSVSTDDSFTEHSKRTVKPITEKTTLKEINTETTQSKITQSTLITFDTSSDSSSKRSGTSTTPDNISTKGHPSEETSDGNDLIYNFSCPSRFGLYPDLENCNFFYQCSNFLPYHMQCPSDLHFNPVLQVCDWPYEAGCENTTSKDMETSTYATSTMHASSTFQPTSTSDHVSSTVKNTFSTEKKSLSTKDVKEITENSTDIKTMISNLPTSSMIDITTTSKPNNLTSVEVSSDNISPNENITIQPLTDSDETSVNMTNLTEKTNQFESTVTDSITKADNVTGKTSSSKFTTEIDLSNITDTTLNPRTKTDFSEITVNFETTTTDTTKKETNVTYFSTEETIGENDMNSTTLNPESKTVSVEVKSESEPTEVSSSSEVDTSSEPIETNTTSEVETSSKSEPGETDTTTEVEASSKFEPIETDSTIEVETNSESQETDTVSEIETSSESLETHTVSEIETSSESLETHTVSEIETSSPFEPKETDSTIEVETSSESESRETETISEIETSSNSGTRETDTASEMETMKTKIVTTFENVTETIKNITDAPELKTSSRKTDFEYTETVIDLQSSTLQNNFTASASEITSTTYNMTTHDYDQKTISTLKENITSTDTATQEFVTFTTSSVPVVNISTRNTNTILESTTNVLTNQTVQTSQSDKMVTTTETLSEETSSDGIVQNFTCISRFGLFPDPENCNYFYQCSHYIPYHIRCPSDLHFNPILQVCDWPYEAGCELNSTDSSKEIDTDYTPHPQTNTTSHISSTSEYQTEETTKKDIISTETESAKETSSESNKLLTSLKSTYKPSSTATPDITRFNGTTASQISNYSTLISTDSTPEFDTETTSTDKQAFTTKNNSAYSTIGSTKETKFEITSSTQQELKTKNGSDYSTMKFTKETETTRVYTEVITTKNNSDDSTINLTNSTKEAEIDTTSPTEEEFVTKNDNYFSTIYVTNFTKEVETETTDSDSQNHTTKNDSDYSTIISTNSTRAEIVTFSESQELTSKSQTESENVTMKYISTNDDKFETTFDYKSTSEKSNDSTTAITSSNKQSTIDETKQPLDFECPSRFGLYPDLQNCSRFYHCSQWIANHMNCPPELHFNPVLQVCDWPTDAGCENITDTEFNSAENEESANSTATSKTIVMSSTTFPSKQDDYTDKSHQPNDSEESSPAYDKNTDEKQGREELSTEITQQKTSTLGTTNEINVSFECPSRFGLYPDKSNCSRFYQCSQWTSYPKQCSPGLHFDADLKVCDSPYKAGCDKSLITNEERRSTEKN